MTFRPSLLIAALLVILPIAVCAGGNDVGTTSFPFLKVNVGARAVGMGGAFTGLANDATALYYNPAGISYVEESAYIAGYHNHITDIQTGFLGYIRRLDQRYHLGLHIGYLNYGEFDRTSAIGERLDTFGGGSMVMAATVSRLISRYSSVGITTKFIYEKVESFSSTGIAWDLGYKYTGDRQRLTAGLMIQNLGAQLSSFGTEKDKLPLTLRAGLGVRPRHLPLQLAADVGLPVDNDPFFALGMEYTRLDPVFIRAGWNSVPSSNYDDAWAGLSVGLGFTVNSGPVKQISYAFSPQSDLGESHRITVTGGM